MQRYGGIRFLCSSANLCGNVIGPILASEGEGPNYISKTWAPFGQPHCRSIATHRGPEHLQKDMRRTAFMVTFLV